MTKAEIFREAHRKTKEFREWLDYCCRPYTATYAEMFVPNLRKIWLEVRRAPHIAAARREEELINEVRGYNRWY